MRPALCQFYECQGWKCTIAESDANEFLAWEAYVGSITRLKEHAVSTCKSEVQQDVVAKASKAVAGLAKMEMSYIPNTLDPLLQCISVLQQSDQLMGALLDEWCMGSGGGGPGGGCVQPNTTNTIHISGAYLLPRAGEDKVYIECKRVGDDNMDEAKAFLFQYDPTAKDLEEDMETHGETRVREKLDVKCYMSALLQSKEEIERLMPVKEYLDQRKRARVEVEASMGVHSSRMAF